MDEEKQKDHKVEGSRVKRRRYPVMGDVVMGDVVVRDVDAEEEDAGMGEGEDVEVVEDVVREDATHPSGWWSPGGIATGNNLSVSTGDTVIRRRAACPADAGEQVTSSLDASS